LPAPRHGEQDGREYHFVDAQTFEAMSARGEFLESARVHGNSYATSRRWIEETRSHDLDIVLEIDWQGARAIRRLYADAVTLFILPPSMEELERRLRARGKDSEAVIRERLANALDEIAHWDDFDYVIINSDFEEAAQDMEAIVRASRLKTARQAALQPDFFGKLASSVPPIAGRQ
jgi:guanylate kinase